MLRRAARLLAADVSLAAQFRAAAGELRRNGWTVLPFNVNDIRPDFVPRAIEVVNAAFVDAQRRAEERNRELRRYGEGEDSRLRVGQEHGFQEIVHRAKGRYDMLHRVSGDPFLLGATDIFKPFVDAVFDAPPDAPEAGSGLEGSHAPYRLQFNGCLFTQPWAAEQLWHVDGGHLFNELCVDEGPERGVTKRGFDASAAGASPAILPPHCINVFIPLVDLEKSSGGTEFCSGSQFFTRDLDPNECAWQREKWKAEIEARGWNGETVQVVVGAGQLLAFDYRCLHRALAHTSSRERPLLYYTYTSRWFSDALNFADLPSLQSPPESNTVFPGSVVDYEEKSLFEDTVRPKFPALLEENVQHTSKDGTTPPLYCDGAAGTQMPSTVGEAMLKQAYFSNANVGGNYATSERTLAMVGAARKAAQAFLGLDSSKDVTFGLNCTNLLFHLSRALELNKSFVLGPGDNVVLSPCCHDANVAPWVYLARARGAEVRWLPIVGGEGDELCVESLGDVLTPNTRVVALGLASNASGRIHDKVVRHIARTLEGFGPEARSRSLLVLDATHYAPHHRLSLKALGGDVVVCSGYKFCGPHMGLMGFNSESGVLYGAKGGMEAAEAVGVMEGSSVVRPHKVGARPDESAPNGLADVLPAGMPSLDNCEISDWEMGTLNYEGLAGFEACVRAYYAHLIGGDATDLPAALDTAFQRIGKHEEQLSARFLAGVRDLLQGGGAGGQYSLKLHGPDESSVKVRTPTFSLSVWTKDGPAADAWLLVNHLNAKNIYCTHGNHYAPALVEDKMGQPAGVTRISFVHYNNAAEVDAVLSAIREFCMGA